MTRTEIETALDAGKLWVQMNNGAWWKVRRNGATRTWKRDPSRFRIPIKAGLRSYSWIDEHCGLTLRVSDAKPSS